jgi:hypothetical protein
MLQLGLRYEMQSTRRKILRIVVPTASFDRATLQKIDFNHYGCRGARIGRHAGAEPSRRARSTLTAKRRIGDGGSWHGINDARLEMKEAAN